jgi:chaperone BCS1
VEYVPTYQAPQLFKWKGYWAEVRRERENSNRMGSINIMGEPGQTMGNLLLTYSLFFYFNVIKLTPCSFFRLYTRDMRALSSFIEDARQRYVKTSQPHVTVYTINQVRTHCPLHM